MADRIELRGLRLSAVIGVLPEERERAQPIEIDLDLEVDLRTSGMSDDLSDTVDYGLVCSEVESLCGALRPLLIESLAERIADLVLGMGPVTAVEVSVRKLRPPVPQQLATSGVRIRRQASGSTT